MALVEIIVLAILQGLTEFLPISSSGHLILVPALLGWSDQGLAFDVAVHVGTLLAVVGYFRHDLLAMTRAWGAHVFSGQRSAESRLAWAVLWATLPAGLAGVLFSDLIEVELRSAMVIAAATAGFGVMLWIADVRGSRRRDTDQMRWTDVLAIGLAQALALIPGTSRSGITMTAGLALGLTRSAAARFSFLLSIPVIALAGGYLATGLIRTPEAVDWAALITGTALSAVSAYLCIRLFLRLIESTGMWPFALYRVLLGGFIVYVYL